MVAESWEHVASSLIKLWKKLWGNVCFQDNKIKQVEERKEKRRDTSVVLEMFQKVNGFSGVDFVQQYGGYNKRTGEKIITTCLNKDLKQ